MIDVTRINNTRFVPVSYTHLDDTAASTAKKTSDNTRSTLSDNSDKLTDAGEKIKDFLKEKLGVTDEEFEKAMADLGLCMQDLLQPANLTDLVVELTGVEDAVAIITNAGLSETLTDVIDYAKQLVSDCLLYTSRCV